MMPVVDGDQVSRPDEEPFAVRRQGHPAGVPGEQPGAQLVLEAPDVAADRLLGDEQPGGRPREAQLLGDGDEVAQGSDVDVDVPDRSDRTHAIRMLVRPDRVLDVATVPVECGRWQQPTICTHIGDTNHDRPRSPGNPVDRTRPCPGRARPARPTAGGPNGARTSRRPSRPRTCRLAQVARRGHRTDAEPARSRPGALAAPRLPGPVRVVVRRGRIRRASRPRG